MVVFAEASRKKSEDGVGIDRTCWYLLNTEIPAIPDHRTKPPVIEAQRITEDILSGQAQRVYKIDGQRIGVPLEYSWIVIIHRIQFWVRYYLFLVLG